MQENGSNSPFGFGGAYTAIVSKIFDLCMLGVLWTILSLPIITIGASTTALYYAVVKSVKNDEGYASRMFFRSFRRNFIQATILWLVTAALFFLLRLNTGILMAKTEGLFGLLMIGFYTAAAVYVILAAAYMFPALSRFEMDTFWFLRIALYMVARYFLTSLVIALILAMAGIFVWRIPLLILLLPGPVTFLISEFMERVLARHMPLDQKDSDNSDSLIDIQNTDNKKNAKNSED